MSSSFPRISYSNCCASIVLLVALGFRLLLILSTDGTNDLRSWHKFALLVEEASVCGAYLEGPSVNHPPLVLWLSEWVLKASILTGITFAGIFRSVTVLFDMLTVVVTYFCAKELGLWSATRLGTLYAIAPISFYISAYHGNTDNILVFLIATALLANLKKLPLIAGLALGLAFNVKVVAVFWMIPCFFSFLRRGLVHHFVLGVSFSLIPVFISISSCSYSFVSNVLLYSPIQERWGMMLILELLGLDCLAYTYQRIAGVLLLVAILLSTMRLLYFKRHDADLFFNTAALVLLLAPGFGLQYILWPLPFVILVSLPLALLFILSGSLLMTLAYIQFITSIVPFASEHNGLFYGYTVVLSVMTYSTLALAWIEVNLGSSMRES